MQLDEALKKTMVESWSAGAGAITESEKDELVERLNRFLSTAEKKDNGLWTRMAAAATESQMLPEMARGLDPDTAFKFAERLLKEKNRDKQAIHHFLNLFRQPHFLKKIYGQKRWESLIYELLLVSDFNLERVFEQRLLEYGRKALFRVMRGSNIEDISWVRVSETVSGFQKGLAALADRGDGTLCKVAFLTENSPTMAMLDLACLTGGIVNVMIPANSVPQHISFILNQSRAEVLIVSNDKQLSKVKSIKSELKYLRKAVLLSGSSIEPWVISLKQMIKDGSSVSDETIAELKKGITMNGLATLMYTSGTTGDPKGIMFSQMNLVYKRFCRAMALPEIGPDDRFLCYLPLFHTFGRYLEMLGCVFWGAQYHFMENPALETMLDNMHRIQPTVFISIPKKWYQIYEHVGQEVDVEFDSPEKIRKALEGATGGKLRWGLSAAGYLESDVFRFFQQNGVELMSGFGMTEATGGITMTPPGKYRDNSLGEPLPGIEVCLGDDGEMLIRGPYVTLGYYEGDDDVKPDLQHWLPTGDVMRQDENGYYEIIDRKKEIYKNIKGETIAPQKIENLFRDFEFINQVFLVGDHKQFNTVLIYPDHEKLAAVDKINPAERINYFSSAVVTVNKFLAPFERIVDFRLTDRPFSEARGELTPKGTYKRRVIERNFDPVIETMYRKNYISLPWKELEIRVPNWFLREKGCLTGDLTAREGGLYNAKSDQLLSMALPDASNKRLVQIGHYVLENNKSYIDFQVLLANPLYWLGNQPLVDFAGEAIYQWYRLDQADPDIRFVRSQDGAKPGVNQGRRFALIASEREYSLEGLHLTVRHLIKSTDEMQDAAIDYLRYILSDDSLPLYMLAREYCIRAELVSDATLRRRLFESGLSHYQGDELERYLYPFLQADTAFIDPNVIAAVTKEVRSDSNLMAVYRVLVHYINRVNDPESLAKSPVASLFNLLAEIGIKHPTRYKKLRQLIVHYQLFAPFSELKQTARRYRLKLLDGFRHWLGENQTVAVDVETGEEYVWADVITFEDDIPDEERGRILNAITKSSIIREAIFLLSHGIMIRLYDIPPGGMWISVIERREHQKFYRISIQTRYQGSYDVTLCVTDKHSERKARKEINWLIHISTSHNGEALVDNFGGYWSEHGMWTHEYTPNNAIERFLTRLSRKDTNEARRRIKALWPFLVWSAAWAHLKFWKRSDYSTELKDKSADNVVIPGHDYQTGIKLVSIEQRQKCDRLSALLVDFYEKFVRQTEQEFTRLKQGSMWYFVFSALLQSEGERKGIVLLRDLLDDEKVPAELQREVKAYLKEHKKWGYLPKALFFAIRRYRRWMALNREAALSAIARNLNELYETYRLVELEEEYPETRVNFFLHTVFEDSDESLRMALLDIVRLQDKASYMSEEVLARISQMQKQFELNEKEAFFLTRLSYPHLKPTDTAELVSLQSNGSPMADVVVRLEDYDARPYLVRRPVSPKEISRLHQIFLEAQLPVNFRPEHQFLIGLSDRGHVIGGVFYSYIDAKTVYMEKIVVSMRYRRKGISEGLMHEFFNRMRGEHVETVTTGFFRPEYFYRFGFKVERKYSGLVKDLTATDET